MAAARGPIHRTGTAAPSAPSAPSATAGVPGAARRVDQPPPPGGYQPPPPAGYAAPPPGYAQPPGGYQPGYPPRNSGTAVAILVLGIAGLVFTCAYGFGVIAAIIALALAPKAKREIAAAGGALTGEGMIKAGVIRLDRGRPHPARPRLRDHLDHRKERSANAAPLVLLTPLA